MWFVKNPSVSILLLVAAVSVPTDAKIRVLSSLDEETVYIIHEKPILTNIDSPSKGMLVMASPSNACKPLVPAPPIPINFTLHDSVEKNSSLSSGADNEFDFSWILLVSWEMYTECTLSTKVDNAIAAGYSVILFEDPAALIDLEPEALSPLLTPVVSSPAYEYGWSDASVYAFTIEPEDWRILKNNFTSDEYAKYYLTFEDGASMSGWFTYFLVGILIIGAIFFTIGLSYVLIQLLVLILLWIRESIVSRIQQVRRDRRRRLPASQLKKIPIQQWNSDMLMDICSICLESFVVADRVRILPCSHVFHQACIDPWLLKQRRKCPNCKRKIVFPDENRDSGSSSDDERTPLIRRTSSGRESTTTSPQNFRSRQNSATRNGDYHNHYHHHGFGNSGNSGGSRQDPRTVADQNVCAPQVTTNSQENTPTGSTSGSSGQDSTAAAACHSQADLKGKVEQLCARMEHVGKKIRKKVKANQISKLDNDISGDTFTDVQPVLVSVTVEASNVLSDSDCDKECPDHESQHQEDSCSSSSNNANQSGDACKSQEFSCSQLSPELEVKVVPDSFAPNSSDRNTANPEET